MITGWCKSHPEGIFMRTYEAKIRENIEPMFYSIEDIEKYRGKIIIVKEDNGSYNNPRNGLSQYVGSLPPKRNDGHTVYWNDSCFEWVEEI